MSAVSPRAMHDALREPWHSLHRQREGVSFGMWVFIGSEVMFFSGAFLLYAVYRFLHPMAFNQASHEAAMWYGTANTVVLLTSSCTMVIASDAARNGFRRLVLRFLPTTAMLGIIFLVIKGFEYRKDLHDGLFPGPHFKLLEPSAQLFWAFYWLLTGVHAVHLTVGIVLVLLMSHQAWRQRRQLVSPSFEGLALYWSFVDMIWVLLYALIYLPGRAA